MGFLRLEQKTVYVDTQRYFLNELPLLYSVLQYIVIETTKTFTNLNSKFNERNIT